MFLITKTVDMSLAIHTPFIDDDWTILILETRYIKDGRETRWGYRWSIVALIFGAIVCGSILLLTRRVGSLSRSC